MGELFRSVSNCGFRRGGNGTRVARRSTNEATRFRSPFAAMRNSVVWIVQLVAFEEADGMFRLYICNRARPMSCRATINDNSTGLANFYARRACKLLGLQLLRLLVPLGVEYL